ncbi:MAG: 50S ribosomal protein L11 methyltransferase [Acidobacteria bacterium]|nr:50S ribosomal protein L11 methyltransferase [Acidobacteriota bacterium]
MRAYPALDVDSTSDLLLALVDDCAPTAAELRGETTRLFFLATAARDAAARALHAAGYDTRRLDVDDEDWARRSQESLEPVTAGRITIVAPWHQAPDAPADGALVVTILPSMGFGTGHHETTRLCLLALQQIDCRGAEALDIGTGSGILAIAADRLGAASSLGVDHDEDAIRSARANLALNPLAVHTDLRRLDLTRAALPAADLVTANLTGALLVRNAGRLLGTLRPGATLILSGVLAEEACEVRAAFAPLQPVREDRLGEWAALTLQHQDPGIRDRSRGTAAR